MGGMMGGGFMNMFGGMGGGMPGGAANMVQMSFSSGGGPGQFVSQSYSYTTQIGPDGRPVVKESQHHVIKDGHMKEERYEMYDGARGQREAGLARAIDDRSVAMRKVAHDDNPDDVETHTALNNLEEDQVAQFDQQWQQGTSQSAAFKAASKAHTQRSALEWRRPPSSRIRG